METSDANPPMPEISRDQENLELCDRYVDEESAKFGDDSTEDNDGLSALQSFDGIFIPEINEIIADSEVGGRIPKSGAVPAEIKDLFQTENLGYTLVYISEEDAMALSEQENHSLLKLENRTSEVSNNDDEDVDRSFTENLSSEDNVRNEEGSMYDSVEQTASVEDNRSHDSSLRHSSKRTSAVPYDNFTKSDADTAATEAITSSKKSTENTSANEDDDDEGDSGSDSDYFVDTKDNLLGSLNDTIVRIKEVKVEGSSMNYQCTLCMQNYDKLTGVLIHTVDNHVPSSGPFFCVVCEKDCESHRELRSHVKTHSGQFPYTCFICNKAYSMKRYLKRHMSCHTDFPRHRCPKCGSRFNTKSELEAHVRSHVHGGAPFACSQCPRVFNHKGNYKRHLISHLDPHGLHLPKYPCNICGKRFLNNRTLATHIRVHTGEKPFKCDVCGRSFSQQGNLLNHVKIHSNPRSYTCEVCGKRFNQRATLRDHGLLHTGEKPYVCNVCGVAFTFSAALRRHMWTHMTDKPFGCEICNARFVGKYDIKRHMKIHTDRPKTRRRANNRPTNEEIGRDPPRDETVDSVSGSPDTQTIFIEQVLLTEDATQIVTQEESEKENVDALFNLIQYG